MSDSQREQAAMQEKLKRGISVLRDCTQRGRALNAEFNPEACQPKLEWFDGYMKACDDIERRVIDAAFSGKPLPALWRLRNEPPGCKQI